MSNQRPSVTIQRVMSLPRVSHGRPTRSVAVGPYTVTEAHYAPHQQVRRHEHRWPSWTLVLAGGFEERFARDTVLGSSNMVLTKPASADHSNTYGPTGASCLLIETRDDAIGARFGTPRVHDAGTVPRLARRIHEELARTDPLARFLLEGLLIELGAATLRSEALPAPRRQAWLNAVRERLEAEFRAPPSLAELAQAHGVHPVYLCQAFRAVFGTSVGQFVRTVRFEWARDALRVGSPDVSIADVAAAAGFSDQAHLTREFKKRAGISPNHYRRTLRSSAPSVDSTRASFS